MKLNTLAICFALLISLYGCSNRQMYEAIQENRQQECNLLPVSQYEDCMKKYEESYDSYKEALDEAAEQ